MSERTLRHLVQYSSLISSAFRSQLLAPATTFAQMRALLLDPPRGSFPDSKTGTDFGLSEFPKLLSGELKLSVPVYTVWGACEDVAILEKIRAAGPSPVTFPGALIRKELPASYAIPNLTVLDEATTRVLTIGGVRLRLFGLGGAVVSHKLFDNGTGRATIAGGAGTMWTTMLQIGEIVDTAQKVRTHSIHATSPGSLIPLAGLRPVRNPSSHLPRLPRSRRTPLPALPRPQGRPHPLCRPSLPIRSLVQRVQRPARFRGV